MVNKLFVFAGWLLLLSLTLLLCFFVGVGLLWKTTTIFIVWIALLMVALTSWSLLLWLSLVIKEKKVHSFFQAFRITQREQILLKNWRTGVKVVKRLHRQKPSVPWYIMMGERCGKTSLLAGAGLPMLSGGIKDTSVVPTQTFRWWFLPTVCFLDLSSHFLESKGSLARTWRQLVRWSAFAPPPAGVVIGISISDLLHGDNGALHYKARKIRIQLEPLIRRFKYQIPVYITINQCDKDFVFSQWIELLSASQQQQALGYYWPHPPLFDRNDFTTLDPLFAVLKEGFALARVSMPEASIAAEAQCASLTFPEDIPRLQAPLWEFLNALCEPSAYFTQTALAGVWFTSSEEQVPNQLQRKTYFVQELFTEHFATFNRCRDVIWRQNKMRRMALPGLLLLGSVAALCYSAFKSAALMHHDSAILPPSAQVELLLRNESRYDSPWIYWPFSIVLNAQHHQIERQWVASVSPHRLNMPQIMASYRQQFINASVETQRRLALELAQTILTLQSMRDGVTLKALMERNNLIQEISWVSTDQSLSLLEMRILQRWMIQQPSGAEHIAALRNLLSTLINHEPTLTWLLAPEISLPAIQLKDFWQHLDVLLTSPDKKLADISHTPLLLVSETPQSASQLNELNPVYVTPTSLSGIWTQEGNMLIKQWIALLSLASQSEQVEALLLHFVETLPAKRQDAWRQLLLGVSQSLQGITPHRLSQRQLIAFSQGDSPAIRFARRMRDELEDVPTEAAQIWLRELRRFVDMQSRSSAETALTKLQDTDINMKNAFARWLNGPKSILSVQPVAEQVHSWERWQEALNAVAHDALNKASLSPELTKGLFSPELEGSNSNPLIMLFATYERLRQTLELQKSRQHDIDAVWMLYKSDASLLLANAIARSSCWLNAEWQSNVVWPMRKNVSSHDYTVQRLLASQYLTDFMRGQAKGLFIVTDQGPQPGEFNGQKLSVTPEFLNLVRHTLSPDDILDRADHKFANNDEESAEISDEVTQLSLQQTELENEMYPIDIVSEPVTVLEGARVFPIGTRLTLQCKKGATVFDSMNFAEKMHFTWQPGQCNRLDLDIKFPDFSVKYRYEGTRAWPDFLEQFKQGEVMFAAREFSENSDLLDERGIKHVLVRFRLSEQQALQEAWKKWLDREALIDELMQRKQRITKQKQGKQLGDTLPGRLSQLPDNVAICR